MWFTGNRSKSVKKNETLRNSVFELRSRMARMISIVEITSPDYNPVPESPLTSLNYFNTFFIQISLINLQTLLVLFYKIKIFN